MGSLFQDLRYGLRGLRRSPGFTAVTVLTLALGIGANTAIFTFVNSILLRPLPYSHPEQLVSVAHIRASSGDSREGISALSFQDYTDMNGVFSDVGAYTGSGANFSGDAWPERIVGMQVSEGFFRTLGIQPSIGRMFSPQDYLPNADHVIVISDPMWRSRFGSDRGVVGRQVRLSGNPYTIIGVVPANFHFDDTANFWRPFIIDPIELSAPVRRAHEYLQMIGRLKPAATLATAQADFARISDSERSRFPTVYPADMNWRIDVRSYAEDVVGSVRPALLVLLGIVGFVLLIACANVANMLLSRAEGRRKEFAVRVALGAGKLALVRQLLAESVLLAVAGGGLGLLLAAFSVQTFVTMSKLWLPRVAEISLDGRALIFTLGICVFTTLLFGLAPGLQVSNVNVHEAMSSSSRGLTNGPRGRKFRNALVIAEVALSLPLLAASALLTQSLWTLIHKDPGFTTQHLLSFQVPLRGTKYSQLQPVFSFYDRLLDGITALLGVQSVGAVSTLPLGGDTFENAFTLQEHPRSPGQSDFIGECFVATPNYFATLGIPLLKGRFFTAEDNAANPHVVIVDEEFARAYLPGEDPIGKLINFEGMPDKPEWRTIVGVVAHVKQRDLTEKTGAADAQYYEPYLQSARMGPPDMTVVVRTTGNPQNQISAARAVMASADPDQPMNHVATMDDLVGKSLADRRFNATLTVLFGALALVLAATGLYGVISYSVGRQVRDIGVRVALGAQQRDILKLVLGQSLLLSVTGVAIGLALAIALARILTALLFGVSATDPGELTLVSVALLGVSMLASYIPARRAMEIEPVQALRQE
jgi:putative ABC transport system permease protein